MNENETVKQIMVCKGMIKIGVAAEYDHLHTLGVELKQCQSIKYSSNT